MCMDIQVNEKKKNMTDRSVDEDVQIVEARINRATPRADPAKRGFLNADYLSTSTSFVLTIFRRNNTWNLNRLFASSSTHIFYRSFFHCVLQIFSDVFWFTFRCCFFVRL
ncbi:uncharacterized protein LOC143423274 [Xylocopa sonorina]|uniref:uncharacterized protein LOC143423274 n=1 Tax=Xylocopa sonorina TaxID=1818115 RepID=UPI00403A9BBB